MYADLGSIWQLRLFQTLDSQQVLNVQHYRVESATPGIPTFDECAQIFAEQYFGELSGIQSAGLTYNRCELVELGGVDIGTYVYTDNEAGTVSGEYTSTFTSYGVRQVRSTRLTRHGQKRIAGVPEAAVINGLVSATVYNGLVLAAAALWDGFQTLEDPGAPGNHIVVAPIIWGGFDALYPDGRYNYISGVVVNTRVTTQNTRKVGRGA